MIDIMTDWLGVMVAAVLSYIAGPTYRIRHDVGVLGIN